MDFDTRRYCSPNRIYVPTDSREKFRIQIEGGTLWKSNYSLKVKDPVTSQDFRVGDFTVRYESLKVRIKSPSPIEGRLFDQPWVSVELKNGSSIGMGGGFGMMGGG